MSEKLLIIGKNSIIAREFLKRIQKKIIVLQPNRSDWNMDNIDFDQDKISLIKSVDKILLLQSVLSSKTFLERKYNDIISQITINLLSIIKISEIALLNNKKVKIIILGSESGIKGSYDIIYAMTKAAVHKYVEERRITFSKQQLICIAPSTIIDAGMTIKRKDKKNIINSFLNNPKKRGVTSKEIANLIYSLFYEHTDYLTNVVINVDGGKFARM